jgi:hypothetical protein
LYLENINVEDESYEQVSRNVKLYAKSKGIRIMSIKIIRNHYCDDVVGCKMLIPECNEHVALDPQTWPDAITCRRWEDRPPRNKAGSRDTRDNGYRNRSWDYETYQGEYDSTSYDYD